MKYAKITVQLLLGLFMTYAGVGHLTHLRQEFVAQVPMWLRWSEGFTDFVVLSSGVVEITLGLAMLLLWRWRGWVGVALALALFYVLIFPGNINQWVYGIDAFGLNTDGLRLLRLFFQPVLVAAALWSTGGWALLRRCTLRGPFAGRG